MIAGSDGPGWSIVNPMGSPGLRLHSRNWRRDVSFSKLVRLLKKNGFILVRQKGSIRYYGKEGWPVLIRVDFHGAKQVPTGTLHAILKAASIRRP